MKSLSETYDQRIKEIHHQYKNVISPFIMQLEVLDGLYPIEILNEIRAVFGHLSKCYLSEGPDAIERNLDKADGHIKRAILDCYKYLCLAYNDKYKEFDNNYRNVDLSEIDNGEFLPVLCKKRIEAINKLTDAKKNELQTSDVEVLYNGFEEAYNAYADVYNLINNSMVKIEYLKRKAKIRSIRPAISFWIGIFGFLVGLVGIILAVVG